MNSPTGTQAQTSKDALDQLCVNTIRTLSMDAVQAANSGHPGTPMALAPLAYVLWTKCMKYNPQNPDWSNRDRFILSCGHASILQFAMLYLTGYDISLDDLKNFRQLNSKAPGHPEYGMTPGIETTTGPLGQGVMNGVGMAIAEAHLAARFNREGYPVVDHYTYAFVSDGDLMEGASHEAASLAGRLGLGKIIYIYDDNHISIEGPTELTYTDDVAKRFQSYNWHVQNVGDAGEDLGKLSRAIRKAQKVEDKPSLIIVRTHIAQGSPNMQDTPAAHGAPLGEEEINLTKKAYGWPEDETFLVPDEALKHMRKALKRGKKSASLWQRMYDGYKKEYPELAAEFESAVAGTLPDGWDADLPVFAPSEGPLATRSASGKALNALAEKVSCLMGGSADLAPSNNSLIKNSGYFDKRHYDNRNIAWGVRELTMCGAASGMAVHGGVRPFVATFFVFTDYARPSIRLAAMMQLPVIYIMTHDSIGLGEDGPTHQPVEHLASMRAMPNMTVIRPADANETIYAWRLALTRTSGPTMLVLTRQKLPIYDRSVLADAEGVLKGAYVLSKENAATPDIILIASGSEVQLILEAQGALEKEGLHARVVSMPSWELFREQPEEYRNEVLPREVTARLAVEAAVPMGWHEWVGDEGDIIAVTQFGASAPYKILFEKYGLTVEQVTGKARVLVGR